MRRPSAENDLSPTKPAGWKGLVRTAEESSRIRHMIRGGRTGFLDKSMHGWGCKAPIANKRFGAGIGNDFANGHRGMAKAVRGAKKFVRTRVRFHENAETRKLAQSIENEEAR